MKTLFTLLLVSCLNIISFAQTSSDQHEYPKTIPTFQFAKMKGDGIFKSNDIKKNKMTLIALVSPECSHCLISLELINNNIDKFKDLNVVFVTEYDKETFYGKVEPLSPNIFKAPNIEILQDTEYEFSSLFKPLSIPTFYLYNKKGELITVKRGSIEVVQLFQHLK